MTLFYSSILKRMATLEEIEIAMHKLAKDLEKLDEKDQGVVFRFLADKLLRKCK